MPFVFFFNCHHELHHADAAATAPTGAVTSLQIGPWHAGQAQCSGNHLGHPSVLSPCRRTRGNPMATTSSCPRMELISAALHKPVVRATGRPPQELAVAEKTALFHHL